MEADGSLPTNSEASGRLGLRDPGPLTANRGAEVYRGGRDAGSDAPLDAGDPTTVNPDHRIRVLIADDDATVRNALSFLIDGEDHLEVVGVASDADQAIELASRVHPDIALLDVQMPGGGGSRATSEIRRMTPRTRVVALSGHGERNFVLEMLRAGPRAISLREHRLKRYSRR